jgi:hypothetical protein
MLKIGGREMNALFGVGLFSVFLGILFLYLGYKDRVSARTRWGTFSGTVGAVCVVFGLALMAFGVL